MTLDVQTWLDTQPTNNGWIILSQSGLGATAKRFFSRNNEDTAARPVLEVTFTPPGPVCNDIDFNNDGLFPDITDIDPLINASAGGVCD